MTRPEHLLCETVRNGLIIAREIEVDIRSLIALKAEENLERDIIALLFELRSANGAFLIGKIDTAAGLGFEHEFTVLTVRAKIMRRKRVYLGNAEHRCNEG